MKCCEYDPCKYVSTSCLHNLLMAHKLDFYMVLGSKGLPVTSALAYLAHSLITKKMRCCEYYPWPLFTTLYFPTNGPDKLECYITLG